MGIGLVIILKVHWQKGFWNSKGGFEFPLSLLAGALGILLIGYLFNAFSFLLV